MYYIKIYFPVQFLKDLYVVCTWYNSILSLLLLIYVTYVITSCILGMYSFTNVFL